MADAGPRHEVYYKKKAFAHLDAEPPHRFGRVGYLASSVRPRLRSPPEVGRSASEVFPDARGDLA